MIDYSQTGEQAAILGAIDQPVNEDPHAPRRFLDIGAWHATDKSNTRALFELGWHGIVVEPSPGPLKELVKEYGLSDRVAVIGAAITVNGGTVQLQVTDDAVSCRPGSAGALTWAKTGGFYGRLWCPSISMADLFNQYGGNFEVVSIDTEGTSVDLFIEMLRIGVRPRVVVLEHDNRIVEVAGYAQKCNYSQVLLNGNNIVYRWG